jgi:hypothetical protein
VVATGPYTSSPISFSAMADWPSKQKYCFSVNACVAANSDVTFSVTKLKFQNHK